MNKTLGARIAELRKEKGLTQEELAKQLGISSQAVSKWEKDISCPDIMILPSLAKILGVSIETLLTGEAETTYVPEEKRKSFEETILYIHVKEGTENIQLNLPLPLLQTLLVDGGMSLDWLGLSCTAEKINWAQIIKLIEHGAMGKLFELTDVDTLIEIIVK